MDFASIRIITDDVDRLVVFYEQLLGTTAQRPVPVFAQFSTSVATLAISDRSTVAMLGADVVETAANRSVVIEFEVADPDAEHARLADAVDSWVLPPTTMPWGNRSTLLRDPDGNLVNLFSRPAA